MILVSGSLTMQVVISCRSCGQEALSRHRVDIQQADAARMGEILEQKFRGFIPDIPVGWAMSGRDNLTCGQCE